MNQAKTEPCGSPSGKVLEIGWSVRVWACNHANSSYIMPGKLVEIDSVAYNRAHIGNDTWGIKLATWLVRSRDPERSMSWPRCIWIANIWYLTLQCHHSCSYAKSRQTDQEVKNNHSNHSTYLPVWLWVLGSHQERCTQDRCPRPMVFAKVVRNQMIPSHVEWGGEMDNRATTPVGYCPSTASFSVRPYCKNARRDRCQEYQNCSPSENWRRPPGRPQTTWMKTIQQDLRSNNLPGWGANCGLESSTLETDVCFWCYTPLVVLATQEEEEYLEEL